MLQIIKIKQMKNNVICAIALSIVMLGSPLCKAQETTADTHHGKPIITIFSDAGTGFDNDGLSTMGFNLERAYLGYQYNLNDQWKAKVVYDMGKGDDNTLQRLGYLKNAEIDFHHGRWALNMGLTSTAQFNVQEKFWGYRYVY